MVGLNFSKSKQKSGPVDLTPQPFTDLQQPFADVLAQLLGSSPTTSGTSTTSPTGSASTGGTTAGNNSGNDEKSGGSGGFNFMNLSGRAQAQPTAPQSTGFAQNDPNNVLSGIPTPSGDFSAGIGENEQALLDQLFGGESSASTDLLNSTIAGNFLPGADGANPFLNSAIEAAQRPTLQGLEELLSRVLPGRFTQAGQFTQPEGSSAFDRSAAIATRGVAGELADIASQLSFANFEGERNRQQQAAVQAPQVSQQEITNLIQNLQAQALPRLIEQAGIEGGIEAFNTQVNGLLQVLALAQGATQPVTGQKSSGSSFGAGVSVLGG